MQCPFCQREINQEAKFCSICGHAIPRCPTCGQVLTARYRFCLNDGTPLPEELLEGLPEPVRRQPKKMTPPQAAPFSNFCRDCGAPCAPDAVLCPRCMKELKRRSGGENSGKWGKVLLVVLIVVALVLVVEVALLVGKNLTGKPLFGGRDKGKGVTSSAVDTKKKSDDRQEVPSIEIIGGADDPDEKITWPSNSGDVIAGGEQPETSDSDSEQYILPDSDRRRLSESELEGMTASECRLARNELYARHGRMFKDADLQSYFNARDWYTPRISSDEFVEESLSETEMYNRDLIVAYEKKHGYR